MSGDTSDYKMAAFAFIEYVNKCDNKPTTFFFQSL